MSCYDTWKARQPDDIGSSPQRNMDRDTRDHFYKWLERTIPYDQQDLVEKLILALWRDYPWVESGNASWPEMRRMAEIMESQGWVP